MNIPKKVDPNRKFRIRYSDNKKFFYIDESFITSTDFWLGVEEFDGPVTDEEKEKARALFSPNWVEYKLSSGRVYHRQYLPFRYWKVHSYKRIEEELSMTDDLILDYLSLLKNIRG